MRVGGHYGSDSGQWKVGGGSVEPAAPPAGCVVQRLVLLSAAKTQRRQKSEGINTLITFYSTCSVFNETKYCPASPANVQAGMFRLINIIF